MLSWRAVAVFLIAVSCCAAGCSKKPPAPTSDVVEPGYAAVNTLSQAYVRAHQQLGHPPKSAAELKKLKDFGDIDKILVSPTDNQPYVVVWGFDTSNSPNQTIVFAYEKIGADGFRHVVTPSGTMKMSAEDFAKASFPPGHKP